MVNRNSLSLIILMFFVTIVLIFGIASVDGKSMMPSLKSNQLIVYTRLVRKYKRFDIVLVEVNNKVYVKRIIGLPGEKVSYKGNELFINDVKIKENYYRTRTNDFNITDILPSQNVLKDEYLIFGDNRSFSNDSRNFGAINLSNIRGKVIIK